MLLNSYLVHGELWTRIHGDKRVGVVTKSLHSNILYLPPPSIIQTNYAGVSCSNTPDSNCTGDLVPGNGKCSCDCGQGFTTTKIRDFEYQYCTRKISSILYHIIPSSCMHNACGETLSI